MLPKIIVRRPRGVVPRVSVSRRTVVEYQPSWLLLALPVAVAASRRRSTARSTAASSTPPGAQQTAPGTAGRGAPSPAPRRGRARLLVVRLVRLRRRPGQPPVVEQADVVVPVQADAEA